MNNLILFFIIFLIIVIFFGVLNFILKSSTENYGVFCGRYNLYQTNAKDNCIRDSNCKWGKINDPATGKIVSWCYDNPYNGGVDSQVSIRNSNLKKQPLPTWVYESSSNLWITPIQNTLIGDWSITNIKNSAKMTISFWINITELNSTWRNIFHVSGSNNDWPNIGDRAPAVWIYPNASNLHIRNDSTNTLNLGIDKSAYTFTLNTPSFVTIIYNISSVSLYVNGNLSDTVTYSPEIQKAISTAKFYISDPWYISTGYQIKDFSLYNSALDTDGIKMIHDAAKKEMNIYKNKEIALDLEDWSYYPIETASDSGYWVYSPTKNTYYTIPQSTLVGNWSTTNISNSATMSISFWLIISETNSNWRNIFHVSNQNVNCCDSGNRIPAMWIEPNNTGVTIAHSSSTDGNMYPDIQYKLPLNTGVFFTIVFNDTTMTLYTNAILQQTYTYPSPLISANSDATFYMGDPWYSFGGFQIKNFTFYNNVLSASGVSKLYKKEMKNQ